MCEIKNTTTDIVQQEDFFDAIRNDPDMTPEQKEYWLQYEHTAGSGEAMVDGT